MEVVKKCCDVPTQFPARMRNCESTLHTLASYSGSNPKTLDYIFTTPNVDVENAKVHEDITDFDHCPISAVVNSFPIVSWNLEGLCQKGKKLDDAKKRLATTTLSDPNTIFVFQELFLKNEIPTDTKLAIQRMHLIFLNPSNFDFFSDEVTGGIAVPKIYKTSDKILIKRPDSNKACIAVTVKNGPNTIRVVNIHLKSVVTNFNGEELQKKEMQNILNELKPDVPTVFIGDFNSTNPMPLFDAPWSFPKRTLPFIIDGYRGGKTPKKHKKRATHKKARIKEA
jgi:exonuclease III